mmetsp:Transcript_13585/g.53594  ORF Transcript_13585/g.53594 Transcript_13585/m.53594 type:complete len:239 (+) Transcript_13585:759-1475(+)
MTPSLSTLWPHGSWYLTPRAGDPLGLSVTGSVVTSTGAPHSLPTMDVPFSKDKESGAGVIPPRPRMFPRPSGFSGRSAMRKFGLAVAGRLLSAHAYLACAPFCRLYASPGECVVSSPFVVSVDPSEDPFVRVVPSATKEKCVASCWVGPAGLPFPMGLPCRDLALPKQSASSGSSCVGKTDALVSLVALPPYGTRPTVSMCECGVHVLCRRASGSDSLSSSGTFSGWWSWCPSSCAAL